MSKYYKQLLVCERRLRRTFITKTVLKNPISRTSQYKIQSYRLLSHAEIEYYIESIILYRIDLEKMKWNTRSIISNCIAHLIAYNRAELPGPSSLLSEISNKNDIKFRINKVITTFESSVKRNNGIKEVDIIPLLVSIGVDYSQISQTLLNNLSSFGKFRGDTAHSSTKIQRLINPNDETGMVQKIVEELHDIDDLIIKMR